MKRENKLFSVFFVLFGGILLTLPEVSLAKKKSTTKKAVKTVKATTERATTTTTTNTTTNTSTTTTTYDNAETLANDVSYRLKSLCSGDTDWAKCFKLANLTDYYSDPSVTALFALASSTDLVTSAKALIETKVNNIANSTCTSTGGKFNSKTGDCKWRVCLKGTGKDGHKLENDSYCKDVSLGKKITCDATEFGVPESELTYNPGETAEQSAAKMTAIVSGISAGVTLATQAFQTISAKSELKRANRIEYYKGCYHFTGNQLIYEDGTGATVSYDKKDVKNCGSNNRHVDKSGNTFCAKTESKGCTADKYKGKLCGNLKNDCYVEIEFPNAITKSEKLKQLIVADGFESKRQGAEIANYNQQMQQMNQMTQYTAGVNNSLSRTPCEGSLTFVFDNETNSKDKAVAKARVMKSDGNWDCQQYYDSNVNNSYFSCRDLNLGKACAFDASFGWYSTSKKDKFDSNYLAMSSNLGQCYQPFTSDCSKCSATNPAICQMNDNTDCSQDWRANAPDPDMQAKCREYNNSTGAITNYNNVLSAYNSANNTLNEQKQYVQDLENQASEGMNQLISTGIGTVTEQIMNGITLDQSIKSNKETMTVSCYIQNSDGSKNNFLKESETAIMSWKKLLQ